MPTGFGQVVNGGEWDQRAVSKAGQVTIPKELREKHGIESGDVVVVGENPDGDLVVVKP